MLALSLGLYVLEGHNYGICNCGGTIVYDAKEEIARLKFQGCGLILCGCDFLGLLLQTVGEQLRP
jgi:hypothetical protein